MNKNNNHKRYRSPDGSDYAIGYGKPPIASRFKPGVSGNPRGRPRGTLGLKAVMGEMMWRHITVTEGGKPKRVPLLEALLLMLSQQALKGDYRAARMLLDAAGRLDYDASIEPPSFMDIEQVKGSMREAAINLLAAVKPAGKPGGQKR